MHSDGVGRMALCGVWSDVCVCVCVFHISSSLFFLIVEHFFGSSSHLVLYVCGYVCDDNDDDVSCVYVLWGCRCRQDLHVGEAQ